jgi:hypothetical protein
LKMGERERCECGKWIKQKGKGQRAWGTRWYSRMFRKKMGRGRKERNREEGGRGIKKKMGK